MTLTPTTIRLQYLQLQYLQNLRLSGLKRLVKARLKGFIQKYLKLKGGCHNNSSLLAMSEGALNSAVSQLFPSFLNALLLPCVIFFWQISSQHTAALSYRGGVLSA